MRWTPGGESSDIEDRRGEGGGGFNFGGFGGLHIGLGGILVLLVLSFVFKVNLLSVFLGGGSTAVAPAQRQVTGEADRGSGEGREVQFVSFVLDDVQHTWDRVLPARRG